MQAVDVFGQIESAKRMGTPLIAVSTSDQQAFVDACDTHLNGSPRVGWDIIRGWRPLNEAGEGAIESVEVEQYEPEQAIADAEKFPSGTIAVIANAHKYFSNAAVIQAVQNIRNPFKATKRLMIFTGVDFQLPPELQSDVVLLEEPLPTTEQLGAILADTYKAFSGAVQDRFNRKLKALTKDALAQATEAIKGLPAFLAEQVVSMSLDADDGLDIEKLWQHKAATINQDPALDFSYKRTPPGEGLLRGLSQIRKFLERIFAGKEPPALIVICDEFEKAMAGGMSDHTGDGGVSKDANYTLLTAIEDNGWHMLLLNGPPGTGKTKLANESGELFGVPVIKLDINATKGGIVGTSEANIRKVMKTILSVGSNRVLFIATTNKQAVLSPEIRRRCRRGIWYIDLLSAEERAEVWPVYEKKYNLTKKQAAKRPNDEGWTGAEIRNCCDFAYQLDCSLVEAAEFIVPVAKTDAKAIDEIRSIAKNTFLSANYPGPYRGPAKAKGKRSFDVS